MEEKGREEGREGTMKGTYRAPDRQPLTPCLLLPQSTLREAWQRVANLMNVVPLEMEKWWSKTEKSVCGVGCGCLWLGGYPARLAHPY